MLLFCDTSALVKLFVEEDGSAAMASLAQASDVQVAVASLAYAEAHAMFARRQREALLRPEELLEVQQLLDSMWPALFEVPFGASSREFIPRLCRSWPLRGADAVHLAAALAMRAEGFDLRFATSDRRQLEAAAGEGLAVLDPVSS